MALGGAYLRPARSTGGWSGPGAQRACWPQAPAPPSAAGTDHSQSLTTNDPAAPVVDLVVFAALSKNERSFSIHPMRRFFFRLFFFIDSTKVV